MSSVWKFLDISKLESTHCYLSDEQRHDLYHQTMQTFTIAADHTGYKIEGLAPNTASITCHQSVWNQFQTIALHFVITWFFFVPPLFMLLLMYYVYHGMYLHCLIGMAVYAVLTLYPIRENKAKLRHHYIYNNFKYFSYRLAWHQDTYEYLQHREDGPLIFASIPHGTLPLGSILCPLIANDVFSGNEPVGTVASVIFTVPIIRNFVLWFGAVSVSKHSIQHVLTRLKKCVGVVCDGIAGIFVQSQQHNECEVVLLRRRKGIAKMTLMCGCAGVVPCYGFGNAQVFKCWFDSYGVLRKLSTLLRVSLVVPYGRWYLWLPLRIPLYKVFGPIVRNNYAGTPIQNPTKQQIDELHERILTETKRMFDQHKAIYGWQHKQLVFV